MKPSHRGPGLAKTRRPALLSLRTALLVTGTDARWKALLEEADVVSEGAARGEDPTRQYFGSTHIHLELRPERADDDIEMLAAVAARDPHLRTRIIRIARREAAQRADGPLDSIRAETTVTRAPSSVTFHVEVEARVFPDRRAAPRPPACAVDS
jgi:hypothetical protein